ncbi:MAG: response regulator [Terracidiphilus sp.]
MPTPPKGQRVLIVDDEPMIADTLAQILNASGFEARAVHNGEKALEVADELKPQVLLTDVIMRGMSGVELALQVSDKLPSCRVILFSGQAATADLLDPAQKKGREFEILTKPIHPKVLLEMLRGGA